MAIWVKILKTEKTIEIHLVRQTEVCGKVLSEKYAYKSVKTALLLSNVIDADAVRPEKDEFISFSLQHFVKFLTHCEIVN